MFGSDPKAREDLKKGTFYAISGEAGWIYYGQITGDKSVGLLRRRDRQIANPDEVLHSPVMAVVAVSYPSIGRALRAGKWKKLGRFPLHQALSVPTRSVHWPVGTLIVTVCSGGDELYYTKVDDPEIQNMELMATWDAVAHIPARLTADFGAETAEWHIGGPIWRERKVKEEFARRFPEMPSHSLPDDWAPTTDR